MKRTDYDRGSALRIFWVDSCHSPGWQYGDRGIPEVERVVTLGFVVASNEEGLVLSTSLSQKGAALAPVIVPWEAITHIQEIPSEWHRESNLPS